MLRIRYYPLYFNLAPGLDTIGLHTRFTTQSRPRLGYITQFLWADVPIETVCDWYNVPPAIIDQHYNIRSKEDEMQQRQTALDNAAIVSSSTHRLGHYCRESQTQTPPSRIWSVTN